LSVMRLDPQRKEKDNAKFEPTEPPHADEAR
jgi:hypothetical protein